MNYGMRCHDLCPKTDIDTLVNTIAANHVDQIQLAMGKSIAGYNFDHGHYSPGFARMIRKNWMKMIFMWLYWGAISIL